MKIRRLARDVKTWAKDGYDNGYSDPSIVILVLTLVAGSYMTTKPMEGERAVGVGFFAGFTGLLAREAINKGLHSVSNLDIGGTTLPVTIDVNYPLINKYMKITIIRIAGEDAEGFYEFSSPRTWAKGGLPGMDAILTSAKKYGGLDAEEVSINYITTFTQALIAAEALRVAMQKVGIDNLSGQAARDALFAIRDFDLKYVPTVSITEVRP